MIYMRETRTLEFKETITNTFLKTVSAFSNYDGGTIYFGIDDDGNIKGLKDVKQACLDIENKINNSISPQPNYTLEIQNNDQTIKLTVKSGIQKPYLYKSKAFKRNDTATIEADTLELSRLILEGKNISFEELPCRQQELSFEILHRKLKEHIQIEAFNQDIYTPEYASGFKILGADNVQSTLIQVFNPWQGAKDVEMSYFISRNGEQAPAGFTGPTIPAGAKQIVCMSSSYIAMLDALGQVYRIVAVSGINYIANPYILAHKDSIKDMGPEMNYELLLGLKPDVVLLYGIGDAQTAVTDKLKELYIPYMYVGEYLEESPLGKAEWLVALAELTDSREKGIEIFREIPKRYQVLKALTESVEQRPTVMLNTPWNDSWVMPSTQSYMAQLVTDAGADYIRPTTGLM